VNRRATIGGFSLIELMIALVAGLIVIGSVLAFTVATVRAYNENIRSTRLTQDMRTAINLAVREARRTGYDATSVTRVLSDDTPTPSYAGLTVSTTNDCFTYQYDRVDTSEYRALKLNSTTGALQAKVGSAAAAVTCSDTSGWVDVSDTDVIKITDFVVQQRKYPFCAGISAVPDPANPTTKTSWEVASGYVSNVGICIKGALKADAGISRAIFDTTRPRAETVTFAHDVILDNGVAPCATPTADVLEDIYDAATQECVTP